MKKKLYFLYKLNYLSVKSKKQPPYVNNYPFFKKTTLILTSTFAQVFLKKKTFFLRLHFFKKTYDNILTLKRVPNSFGNIYFFLNTFVLNFLETYLKKKIIFNIKKGSNYLILKQIGSRKFFLKYFKKNLKVSKRVLGILYYSLLLKDASIFVNYCGNVLEKLNIKLHKKVFLGFKKLLKDVFKPIFVYLGVLGLFFNVKGKIGVSGSAKKRRYFFSYGSHSLTTRVIKIDNKFLPI